MKVLHLAITAAVLVAGARSSFADDKAEAKKHVAAAMKLHGQNKFLEALDELSQAYALDPQPDLLYAIGQVQVKLDRCVDAIPFYERFLDSNPKPGPAAAAREAIAVCKKKLDAQPKPAEPIIEQKPIEQSPIVQKPIAQTIEQKPIEQSPIVQKPIEQDPIEQSPIVQKPIEPMIEQPPRQDMPADSVPWYKDTIGDALVGGGIAAGIVGLVMYRTASSELDKAEHAPTYQASVDLVDQAHSAQTFSIVAGAGSVVLIGAGIIHIVIHQRVGEARGIAIAPAVHGGFVTWRGSF